MDERLKNAFLELLRSGIWGTRPNVAYFSDFSEADWYIVHTIVCKQAVIAVCLQAVCRLPESCRPPSSLLLKWIGQGKYIEGQNRKIAEIWTELNEKFSAEGICPVILKGLSFANNYPNPLVRQAGDLDLLIPDQFEKTIALVKRWGYQVQSTLQHDSFYYKEIAIELHPRINSFEYNYRLPCHVAIATFDSVTIRIPDVNTECILLLLHAAKHLVNVGIGYRLLCDWAVFLKRNYQRLDVQLLSDEIQHIGIQHFVAEFTDLAFRELNLSIAELEFWRKGSSLKYSRQLAEELWSWGDFENIRNKATSLNSFWSKIDFYILCKIRRRYYWPRVFWKNLPNLLGSIILFRIKKYINICLKKTPHRT